MNGQYPSVNHIDGTYILHPELYYRITGEWNGWVEFFKLNNLEVGGKHKRIDNKENKQFKKLKQMFGEVKYQQREINYWTIFNK
jgi:hypothetical protein